MLWCIKYIYGTFWFKKQWYLCEWTVAILPYYILHLRENQSNKKRWMSKLYLPPLILFRDGFLCNEWWIDLTRNVIKFFFRKRDKLSINIIIRQLNDKFMRNQNCFNWYTLSNWTFIIIIFKGLEKLAKGSKVRIF